MPSRLKLKRPQTAKMYKDDLAKLYADTQILVDQESQATLKRRAKL